MLPATRISFIEQLQASPQSDAWQQFMDIYGQFLMHWFSCEGVQHADAQDVCQEVLSAVSQTIETFEHNGREGAFRCWLRRIAANRLNRQWRKKSKRQRESGGANLIEIADQLADDSSRMSIIWEHEHDQFVLQSLLARLEQRFSPQSIEAFRRVAINLEDARAVADRLEMSLGAVRVAQHRVLKALKAEAKNLVSISYDESADDSSDNGRQEVAK